MNRNGRTTQDSVFCTAVKGAAVVMWTVSLALFAGGLGHGDGDPIDFYAWGCLAGMVAMTFTWISTLIAQFRKEAQAAQEFLARETARALADELEERGLVQSSGYEDSNGVTHLR